MITLPTWAEALLVIGAALLLAYLVQRLLYPVLERAVSGRDLQWRSLVSRSRRPAGLAIAVAFVAVATRFAPLTSVEAGTVRHVLLIGIIVLGAWLAQTALHIWTTIYLRRYKLDVDDNLIARKFVTQSRILRRVAEVLIAIVATAAVLMSFEGVRQFGVSLLASAGAAGLVVGLALQPLLKNLFAGIQLALTQPIRIDDALVIEGEFGNVEEITSTYVVIRLWDKRRLIVPLNHFMEKPFQNWTREDAALIGAIFLYVDYSADVDAIRAAVAEVLNRSQNWDGVVSAVQVTDLREQVMEIRVLASASSAGKAFDLRCELREALARFVSQKHPGNLPKIRSDVTLDGSLRGLRGSGHGSRHRPGEEADEHSQSTDRRPARGDDGAGEADARKGRRHHG